MFWLLRYIIPKKIGGTWLEYEGRTVELWNVAGRQRVATLTGHTGWVSSVAFSPDGTLLASGSADNTIGLWDVAKRQRVATLTGHTGWVSSVVFSPDGTLLASGSADNTIGLWDAASTQQVATIAGHAATVTSVVFSPDGTLLASGSADNTIGLWDMSKLDIAQTPHSLTKVSGDGQQRPANTRLVKPFVVSVLNQDDSPLSAVRVAFSVTYGGGLLSSATNADPCAVGASASSIASYTDANGQAATRLTLGSESGTNTVTATVAGLEPVTFTATAAEQAMPHSLEKVCGDDQEGTSGAPLPELLVVSVADEDGTAIAGVVVSFAVTAGGGALSSATATTDANGRAATRLTLGSKSGVNTVTATVAGLESVTFTATGQEDSFVSLFGSFGGGKLVALPDSPQLAQNAPNPFNSQTVLSYFLPAPSPAHLAVFTLTGQRVAVLHQGPQQAGYHRLHWDGRDDAGRSVASGMYLYRLVTAEDVLTRKLVLLR